MDEAEQEGESPTRLERGETRLLRGEEALDGLLRVAAELVERQQEAP